MTTTQARRGLTIEGLTAGYGKAVVLHGLDLTVAPGEIVGVAGPNGAGKSTLLRAISGTIARTASTMSFGGEPLRKDPVRTCAQGIVHVPEGRQLFARLTVRENLMVGALGRRVRDYRSVDRVVTMFPRLEPLLDRKAGVLSGGQQQLVAVGRGLIGEPDLLLVDEMSLGLSPSAVAEVSAATVEACRNHGTALLWVDQNVTTLAARCERLILLSDGVVRPLSADESSGSVYF